MLELIEELRRLDFTVGIVTGGGTEFVRAVSQDLYAVPPELVVGTLIGYRLTTDASGAPELRRTAGLDGEANEGAAKVSDIQSQLGRRPCWRPATPAVTGRCWSGPSAAPGGLALLVDHDDADREFAYRSMAVTVAEPEPITVVAERLRLDRGQHGAGLGVVFGPMTDGSSGGDLDRLRRWEDAGGTWRVTARRAETVTIALCRCDGGEEVDRLHRSGAGGPRTTSATGRPARMPGDGLAD